MTDFTSLENATQTAKVNLARAADNYSACFKRILRVIEIIEENLREKRGRMEGFQARHEQLIHEYKLLGQSLEWETADLAQKITGAINDLGTDVEFMRLLLGDGPAQTAGSDSATSSPGLAPAPHFDDEGRPSPPEEQDELRPLRPALKRVLRRGIRSSALSTHSETTQSRE